MFHMENRTGLYVSIFHISHLFKTGSFPNKVDLSDALLCWDQTSSGDEAFNPDGLVPRCIRLLKDKFPDLVSYTNICEDRNVAHLIDHCDHCAHLCILNTFWWVSHIGQLRACVMVYCEHFAGYLH
jgi:hypothetical protein